MAEIGYATLPIIPSLKGSSAQIQQQLARMLGASGEAAGMKAGRQIGAGVTKGVGAAGVKAGEEIGTGVMKGAGAAGAKAGREIGVGVTRGAAGAGLKAGEEISAGVTKGASGAREGGLFANIGKGATVAGVGAGRRFGTAFRESTLEYVKTVGTAMVGYMAFEKIVETFKEFAEQGERAEKTARLTEQVIRSTGGAANVTAEDVHNLSDAIGRKAGVDDATIQSGANLMLTFRNVRNEAGKGNDMFNRSVKVTTDMARALAAANGGTMDLRSSTIQIGKALNDPIHGMSMLQRVGVTFTDQQKNQAKRLEETGHLMAAQKIIMGELTKEFGGAAAAMATPADKLKASWTTMEQNVGQKLLPVVDRVANIGISGLSGLAGAVSKLPGPVRAAALAFGALRAAQAIGGSSALAGALTRVRTTASRAGLSLRAIAGDAAMAGKSFMVAGARTEREQAALARTGRVVAKAGMAIGAMAITSTGAADKVGLANTATLGLTAAFLDINPAIGATVGLFLDAGKAAGNLENAYNALGESKGLEELSSNYTKLKGQLYDLNNTKPGDFGDAWHDTMTEVGMGLRQLAGGPSKGDMEARLEAARKKIRQLSAAERLNVEASGALHDGMQKAAAAAKALRTNVAGIVGKFMNFEGAVTKAKGSVAGFEHQLAMQAKAMRNFANNAQKVASSGVRGVGGLVQRLAQMGPAGAALMAQLAHGSRRSIAQAVRDLGNWQGAGRRTAAILTRVLGSAAAKRYLMKLGLNPDPVRKGADAAKRDVRGVTAPKWLARVNADIGGLLSSVRRAQNALDGMHDKWVTVHTVYDYIGKAFNGKASGGLVTGPGSGTSDSIPTMLSNREFVVNAAQTAKYLPLLHAINSGTHGYAYGGLVTPRGAAPTSSSPAAPGVIQLPEGMTLMVGDMEFDAYIDARIDDRISA